MNKLKIKNYRSIRNADLDLVPGINVFVGRTDAGKSNIVRAIRDLAFSNTGEDFITHGEKQCSVELDGVEWIKGGDKNDYECKKGKYARVGRESPEDVKAETGLREVEWGDGRVKRLQFVEQFEEKFFIGYSGTTCARILGRVSGIERTYAAQRSLSKDQRDIANENRYAKKDFEESNEALGKMPNWAPLADRMSGVIAKSIEGLAKLEQNIESMKSLSEDLLNLEKELSEIIIVEPRNAGGNVRELTDTVSRSERILKLLEDINNQEDTVSESVPVCVPIQRMNEDIDSATSLLNRANEAAMTHREIVLGSERVSELDEAQEEGDRDLLDAKNEFESFLSSTDVCPLTNGKFYKDCKANIAKAGV